MKLITAYTDGSSRGNPGPGGIGIHLSFNGNDKEFSFGFYNVTNNQMELLAAAYALYVLTERCKVVLYSDSAYVVNGFNKKWVHGWKKNGWKNSSGKDVKNPKLWKILDRLVSKHDVTFKHVKAHSGFKYNEIVDKLAVAGAIGHKLDFDKFISEMEKKI